MTVFNFNCFIALLLGCALASPVWASEIPSAIPNNQLFPTEVSRHLGLQDPDQGALPNDFWQDAPAADILPLLDQLPVKQSLNIAQQLQLRLLLSTARPPNDVTPQNWLAHRLQKLVVMRAYHQAAQLYSLAWRNEPMPEAAQLALTTLHIAANESDAACLKYLAARPTAQNNDWQYIQAYCAQAVPKLINAPALSTSDPRMVMIAQLPINAEKRAAFAQAMLPIFVLNKPVSVEKAGDEQPAPAPLIGTAWLQNNSTGQPALMHLHGLLVLADGSNKNLVRQRWHANGLTDEAQALASGKLPAPPPEE